MKSTNIDSPDGPLADFASGFAGRLNEQGYKSLTVDGQLRLMGHVSRWLFSKGLGPGDLSERRVVEFLKVRRTEGYTQLLSPLAVTPLWSTFENWACHQRRFRCHPPRRWTNYWSSFRSYLVTEKGLAMPTVRSYVDVARLFLSQRPNPPGLDLLDLECDRDHRVRGPRECRDQQRRVDRLRGLWPSCAAALSLRRRTVCFGRWPRRCRRHRDGGRRASTLDRCRHRLDTCSRVAIGGPGPADGTSPS